MVSKTPKRKSNSPKKSKSPERKTPTTPPKSPRRSSGLKRLFRDTCNNAYSYIQNIKTPKLILGATPSDTRIESRFPGNSFVFLDIREEPYENHIVCDMNDIKELEYLSKTFRKKFEKIIFDTAVLKFLDWGVPQLELVKKMLIPGGQFIMPAPNCKTGNISSTIGIPRITNKKLDYPNFSQWDPSEKEFLDIVNKVYDEIPLTLSPPCFIPDSWRKKYVLRPQELNMLTNKLYNVILYYNDFLLKIVFKNVELVDYEKNMNNMLGYGFVQSTPLFICSN
jgi:hypothetical protein